MPNRVVIDTNILLDNPEILLNKEINPVIPYTVLHELDGLKRNPDLKRAAQSAIKLIYAGMKDGHIDIPGVPTSYETADEKIIKSAKKLKIPVLTDDIGARAVAMSRNVEIIEDFEDDSIDYEYKGYCIVAGDLNYEQDMVQIKEMQDVEFQERFDCILKENQYCIIDRVVDKNDIWKKRGNKVLRISQSMKPYKDAGVLITPMDSIQMAAIDAIFDLDVPLTVIDGKLGTGKTLLSLMGALAHTTGQRRYESFDQIMVTKPPVSVNRNLYTGFKPGTSEEKMSGHLGGIKSNLKFLLDKRDTSKNRDLTESIASKIWDEYFGVIEIDEIQGTSLHNTCLIVDEFQLLSTDDLKLVLSRISEGSKVILVGDVWGQTYGINRGNEGFKTLYRHLGKAPEFNYIRLENIYRSKLAEFVESIFD
jgi:PhoH-like ATPase